MTFYDWVVHGLGETSCSDSTESMLKMKGCRIHFLCNGLIFKKTIDIKAMEFSHYIFLLFSLFFLLLAPELTYECPHLCIYRDTSLSLESKFLFMKFKLEQKDRVMVQRSSSSGQWERCCRESYRYLGLEIVLLSLLINYHKNEMTDRLIKGI